MSITAKNIHIPLCEALNEEYGYIPLDYRSTPQWIQWVGPKFDLSFEELGGTGSYRPGWRRNLLIAKATKDGLEGILIDNGSAGLRIVGKKLEGEKKTCSSGEIAAYHFTMQVEQNSQSEKLHFGAVEKITYDDLKNSADDFLAIPAFNNKGPYFYHSPQKIGGDRLYKALAAKIKPI
ncbi:MAG: hypothetical protein KKF44_00435 [Nanoarchaeota archaeon]|nr:hypothetical protein [Nanoarchaeota archaeon]